MSFQKTQRVCQRSLLWTTIRRMKDEALTSSLILVLHPYPDQGAGIGAGDTGTAAG
jgi:hypothetical protein